jgi:pantetheine-phosphate adenylyltransferase
MAIGVYPGSFDPLHNGHLDLIERSLQLFDRLYVAVLNNDAKSPLFAVEERVELLREVTAGRDAAGGRSGVTPCEVESFSGLLVDYARRRGAQAIVRGLRSVTDFDYELPMTRMNRHLGPGIDTVFLLPDARWSSLSSSLIKEVARLGGDVESLVPAKVHERLLAKVRG